MYQLATHAELTEKFGSDIATRILESCCQTCGGQLARRGDMCPSCSEKFEAQLLAVHTVFCSMLSPHYVHSHRHGLLDPFDRRDRRHLDP